MSHSEPGAPRPTRWIDRGTHWLRAATFGLPAWPFFVGVALALAGCSVAGRMVAGQPMFERFVRFFSPIQPQRYFYPTASQLVAHIRATVPRDKTLVLVGGASYFRGTGQNPRDLWSLELQRQLGKGYAVVNFATDQADLTAFAAVVYEILGRDYPGMAYVANGSLNLVPPIDGGEDYRYLFWDAYYKGLLPADVAEAPAVAELRRRELQTAAGLETHLGKWLDARAYACDLWTWIAYKKAFTVWVDEQYRNPWGARGREEEGDDPNLALHQANTRKDKGYTEHSERHAKGMANTNFRQTPAKGWEPDMAAWGKFERDLATLFPAELRSRCYVVLLRGNPFFMQTLTTEERQRIEEIYTFSRQAYENAGYKVVTFSSGDFNADDFIDGGHLMASGGVKVARAVAAKFEDKERSREAAQPLNSPKGGPLEVAFALPNDRAKRVEPLLSIASGPGLETFSIEYLGGENLRLIYQASPTAAPVFSPPFPASIASAIHSVRISLGSLYPRSAKDTGGVFTEPELATLKSWLLLRLDERPYWEVPLDRHDGPPGDILLGINPRSPIPNDRFTGTFYLAERRPAAARPLRRHETGGARVTLTLSPAMKGRSFPLLTTGKTGEGDVLFFRVNDKGAIVVGYDHWGSPLLLSPEIPVGFGLPHTLEFHAPALDAAGPASVTISVDGKPAWQQAVPVFRPAPEHIYFGENPIGSTTAETKLINASFEGVLTPNWRG